MNRACPLCNEYMYEKGIGEVCPNCGYVHVPSPLAPPPQEKKQTNWTKVTILIIVLFVLVNIVVYAITLYANVLRL